MKRIPCFQAMCCAYQYPHDMSRNTKYEKEKEVIKCESIKYHVAFLGAVQALDLNPFQPNLLASGASDSEIYVWDLNNPDNPLTPGAKSLPPDNISCLAWNRQVQHILASTSPCGRCVVWDLRKNEPIIKVSDQGSMVCSVTFVKLKLQTSCREVQRCGCAILALDNAYIWLRFQATSVKFHQLLFSPC